MRRRINASVARSWNASSTSSTLARLDLRLQSTSPAVGLQPDAASMRSVVSSSHPISITKKDAATGPVAHSGGKPKGQQPFTLLALQLEADHCTSTYREKHPFEYKWSSAILTEAKNQFLPLVIRVYDRPPPKYPFINNKKKKVEDKGHSPTKWLEYQYGDDLRERHSSDHPIVVYLDASNLKVQWKRDHMDSSDIDHLDDPLSLFTPSAGSKFTFDLYSQNEISTKLIASTCCNTAVRYSLPNEVGEALAIMRLHHGDGPASTSAPIELLRVMVAPSGYILDRWFPCNFATTPQALDELVDSYIGWNRGHHNYARESSDYDDKPTTCSSSSLAQLPSPTMFEWFRWASQEYQMLEYDYEAHAAADREAHHSFSVYIERMESNSVLTKYQCANGIFPQRFINSDVTSNGAMINTSGTQTADLTFLADLIEMLLTDGARLGVPTSMDQLKYWVIKGDSLSEDTPVQSRYVTLEDMHDNGTATSVTEPFIAYSVALRSLCESILPGGHTWWSHNTKEVTSLVHTILLAGMLRCEHELKAAAASSSTSTEEEAAKIDPQRFTHLLLQSQNALLVDLAQGLRLAMDALVAARVSEGTQNPTYMTQKQKATKERARPPTHAIWATGYLIDFIRIVSEADIIGNSTRMLLETNKRHPEIFLQVIELFSIISHCALFVKNDSVISKHTDVAVWKATAEAAHEAILVLLEHDPVTMSTDEGRNEAGSSEPWHSVHRPFLLVLREMIHTLHTNPWTDAMFGNKLADNAPPTKTSAFDRFQAICTQTLAGPVEERTLIKRIACFAEDLNIRRQRTSMTPVAPVDKYDFLQKSFTFEADNQREAYQPTDAENNEAIEKVPNEGRNNTCARLTSIEWDLRNEVATKVALKDTATKRRHLISVSHDISQVPFNITAASEARILNYVHNKANRCTLGLPVLADPHCAEGIVALERLRAIWMPSSRYNKLVNNSIPHSGKESGNFHSNFVSMRRVILFGLNVISASGGQYYLRQGGLLPLYDLKYPIARTREMWEVAKVAGAVCVAQGQSKRAVIIIRAHNSTLSHSSSPLFEAASVVASARKTFEASIIDIAPHLLSPATQVIVQEMKAKVDDLLSSHAQEASASLDEGGQADSNAEDAKGNCYLEDSFQRLLRSTGDHTFVTSDILEASEGDEPVAQQDEQSEEGDEDTTHEKTLDKENTARRNIETNQSHGTDSSRQLERVADILDSCAVINSTVQGKLNMTTETKKDTSAKLNNQDKESLATSNSLPYDRRLTNAFRFSEASSTTAAIASYPILNFITTHVKKDCGKNKLEEIAIVFKGPLLLPVVATTKDELWTHLQV